MINDNGKELFDEMLKWALIVIEEGGKFYDDGNKAAGARARKAMLIVCKLRTAWAKAMIHDGEVAK